MKRYFLSLFFLAFFSSFLLGDLSELDLKSEVVLLINQDTGRVLLEKNAHEQFAPASITKIATALFALKELGEDLSEVIEADQDCIGSITAEMQKGMDYRHPAHWLVIGGTHMSIAKGNRLSLEELFYGMMLISANDCSNMIAKYVSGSIKQFMIDLNDYLEQIGCKNTRFQNPHGLHFPNHYTTAYDMGLITKEALKYPFFQKVFSTEKYVRPSKEKEKDNTIWNSNMLIRNGNHLYYPQVIGGKTGKHSEAKNSLVAQAKYKDRRLIAVLMQCPVLNDVFVDAKKLFEEAFLETLVEEVYLQKGPQPFKQQIPGAKKTLKTFLKEDITLSYYPSEKPKVKGEIHWLVEKTPVTKGEVVATLILKDEYDQVLKKVSLFAQNKLISQSKSYRIFFSILAVILIIGGIFFLKMLKEVKPT